MLQPEQLFDRAARYYRGLNAEEFLDLWESGYYEEPDSLKL